MPISKMPDVLELFMFEDASEAPGPALRFVQLYQKIAREIEDARDASRKRFEALWRPELDALYAKHKGAERYFATLNRLRQDFEQEKDTAKLEAESKKAADQYDIDERARKPAFDAFWADHKAKYGARNAAELEAYAKAGQALYKAFADGLEAAIVAAQAAAEHVASDYEESLSRADGLLAKNDFKQD